MLCKQNEGIENGGNQQGCWQSLIPLIAGMACKIIEDSDDRKMLDYNK